MTFAPFTLFLVLFCFQSSLKAQAKYDFDISLNVPIVSAMHSDPTGLAEYEARVYPSLSLGLTRHFRLANDFSLICGLGYRRFYADVNYVISTRLFMYDAILDEQHIISKQDAVYIRLGLKKQASNRFAVFAHFDLANSNSGEVIGKVNHSTIAFGWIPYISDEIVDLASFSVTSSGKNSGFDSEGFLMLGAEYQVTDRIFTHLSAQYNVLILNEPYIHSHKIQGHHEYVTKGETLTQNNSLSRRYIGIQLGVHYVIAKYKDKKGS